MADSGAELGGERDGSGIEEATPDLLKNTPSNIARLEDVIEHCEGRRKYLAQTRSPSDGSDVRWYYCKVPLAVNELAASVPRTEIVGKSEYFRFGMRDSLAIEASFLQREEELLSCWWKEFAECSDGPKARLISSTEDPQSRTSTDLSAQLYEVEEERVGVPVKGGLYEVDLGGLDWLPLREDVAEQLEFAYRCQVWHRRTFQPSGLFAARVDVQGSTPGLHALFTGEDGTWEAWLNVDSSGFTGAIGFSGNGIKLRRGFSGSQSPKPTQNELRQQKEEQMDDYCSQVPVGHLVFMVHGIGQRLEKSNLIDDVTNFWHVTASLTEEHLTPYQRDTQRVLFIPCQWRKGLKLSGEAAVDKITLDGVRGLRVTLSATVHDVLYYMSPIYCQDIIDSVSNQLNRLYQKFLKRNPGYSGKVSIYGHSLGSVLSYDILCHQENLSSPFPMNTVYKEQNESEQSSSGNQQYLQSKSSTDMEHRSVSSMDKATKNLFPTIEDEESTELSPSVHDEQCTQSSCSASPAKPDSDELSPWVSASKQPKNEDDVHQVLDESNNMLSQDRDGLDEAANRNYGSKEGSEERLNHRAYEDVYDKERVIELLKEEIDSLKEKIAELKLRSFGKKEAEVSPQDDSPGKNDEAYRSYTPYIKYTKLEFKVDTFFAVGSPLGLFLALRNIRLGIGKGKDYWCEENITEEMPACRQMFNIFHPFDPVAYRVEPLVCKEYTDKRPVIIPYHRGGKRLHIGFQEFTEDLAARSQAIMDNLNFVRVKVLTVCQSKNRDYLEEAAEAGQEKQERSYGSLMMEELTGSEEGRIDHVLQDKTFQHPYISALGSHTNYWRDHDTALFILKHLYREIPKERYFSQDPEVSGAKNGVAGAGWCEVRGAAEEELPLTFSDSILVRSFSKKAKKVVKP
ncbi:DDHD domain-containing protein [Psidium guajava]|nr:DDHD domain-containing protein [Psidium guajava]